MFFLRVFLYGNRLFWIVLAATVSLHDLLSRLLTSLLQPCLLPTPHSRFCCSFSDPSYILAREANWTPSRAHAKAHLFRSPSLSLSDSPPRPDGQHRRLPPSSPPPAPAQDADAARVPSPRRRRGNRGGPRCVLVDFSALSKLTAYTDLLTGGRPISFHIYAADKPEEDLITGPYKTPVQHVSFSRKWMQLNLLAVTTSRTRAPRRTRNLCTATLAPAPSSCISRSLRARATSLSSVWMGQLRF